MNAVTAELLIQCYYLGLTWSSGASPAVADGYQYLLDRGAIETSEEPNKFNITAKGRAWVDGMLNVPEPVAVWEVPGSPAPLPPTSMLPGLEPVQLPQPKVAVTSETSLTEQLGLSSMICPVDAQPCRNGCSSYETRQCGHGAFPDGSTAKPNPD